MNTLEIMQAQEYRPRRTVFDPMADAEPEFICPNCGAPVYQGERYFKCGCLVIACEHCPSELA